MMPRQPYPNKLKLFERMANSHRRGHLDDDAGPLQESPQVATVISDVGALTLRASFDRGRARLMVLVRRQLPRYHNEKWGLTD